MTSPTVLSDLIVKDAMSILNERELVAVHMHYWEGKTEDAIAAESGLTQPAIWGILRAAEKKMKKHLMKMPPKSIKKGEGREISATQATR
jgi:DNA-directed RNA polymerase specialized sigma subunit